MSVVAQSLLPLLLPLAVGAAASSPSSVATDGWEGFFPPAAVDDAWLGRKGIPLKAAVVLSPGARVAKLVIALSTRTSTSEESVEKAARYCSPSRVREWNKELCAALDSRRCGGDGCSYRDFGNCSGFLLGGGAFLTAAHCAFDLAEDPALAALSAIVVPGPDGRPAKRLRLGSVKLGKRAWLAAKEEDPLDVAVIQVRDGGLKPWPVAPPPPAGSAVFIYGFPRVERRPKPAREALGYALVPGLPSLSFGRISDRNEGDRPLCDVDGDQEHWRLRAPCPAGEVATERGRESTGVILASPFLATYDTCNGYSGAPVFDEEGRLVGVNDTVVGGENPQEGFFPSTRAVGTPAVRALSRLGVR